jgi:hypothetical protein
VSPAYTTQATNNVKKQYTEAAFNAFPKSLRDKLVKGDARLIAVLQSCPSDRLISHILVRTEAEANAALAQIRAGKTFTEVAQKTSIDGSARAAGARVPLPNQFDPAFQEAARRQRLTPDRAGQDAVRLPPHPSPATGIPHWRATSRLRRPCRTACGAQRAPAEARRVGRPWRRDVGRTTPRTQGLLRRSAGRAASTSEKG